MDSGKVVFLRSPAQEHPGKCSVFIRQMPGNVVAYEIDGVAADKDSLLNTANLLEAVTSDLRVKAATAKQI